MPLYEYECESCGERLEKIQKFSDPPLTVCPGCGGALRKLPSSPAIQFKGSGWYITDYAKKSSSEGTKAASSDSKGSDPGKKADTASGSESSSPPADSKKTT